MGRALVGWPACSLVSPPAGCHRSGLGLRVKHHRDEPPVVSLNLVRVADRQRSAEELAGLSKVSGAIAVALTAVLTFVLRLGAPKSLDILAAGVTVASALLTLTLLLAERRARERERGGDAAVATDPSGLRRLTVLAICVILTVGVIGFVVGDSGVKDPGSKVLAPSVGYAEGLQQVRDPLNRTRVRERRVLVSAAATSEQQSRAADRLRAAFAQALEAARRVRVPPQHESATDRILTALADTRDAYADLARSARSRRATEFQNAKDDVRNAERRVQAALGALRQARLSHRLDEP